MDNDDVQFDADDLPLRERLRLRTGLSVRQWTWALTVLISLPYPLFVYVFVTYPVNETLFLGITFVYSVVAIVAYFTL